MLLGIGPENETYIFGDFDICLLNKQNNYCKSYCNMLTMYNLKQIINEPTRITDCTKSLIDHIICNTEDKIIKSGVISTGLSDHCLT